MRCRLIVSALIGLAASPALAQSGAACADTIAAASKQCLAQRYADADRLMAAAYKQAAERADASGLGRNLTMDWKRALLDAQRKWLAFREAHCGPPIAYETADRADQREVAQLRCRIAHTEARFVRLDAAGRPAAVPK